MVAEYNSNENTERDESMALVPAAPATFGMVKPLASAQEAQQAIAAYENLKRAIVRPDDVQRIQGRDFLKKSFWRRVATCFGLSLELVSEQRGFDEGGKLFYSVIYRAIAPNGRTMTGDGYCSTAESGRGGWPEHNVRATAHTRAKNRAISDLVGGGEVSAEEMPDDEPRQQQHQQHQHAAPARRTVRPAPATVVESQPTAAKAHSWADLKARAATLGIDEANWPLTVQGWTGKAEGHTAEDWKTVRDRLDQRERMEATDLTQMGEMRV